MKIKLFILSTLVIIHLSAKSQNSSSLSGSISNELSEAVAGASVDVLNTNFSTFTDNNGNFLFENIAAGKYIVQVTAPGYASVHETVQLSGSGTITIRLARSAAQLDAITVTAQKREEDLQEVPFSISTLSARKVREYKLWNSKDLAAVVPNLYAAHPGDNRNVISVRGITTTSYDPAIATYIDGVNQFGLDTYIAQLMDIERIEVLRGPQGTLYGRNAMGGVINIITKEPGNTTSGYLSADIGNYGQQRYGLGLRTPLAANKLFLGVAGMYDSQNGFYTNVFNDSDYDQAHSFMGNYYLKYLASQRWSLTLNVKHDQNRNKGAFPLVIGSEQALENPFEVTQNTLTNLVDNVFNASLSANYFGDSFNFSSQTAWQTNHRYYTDPIDGDFFPIDGISVINNYGKEWNNVKVATQEFRFSSAESSGSPFRWTAGAYAFYQDNPVRQGTYFGEDAAMVDPGAVANSTIININKGNSFGIAFYGQGTYNLTPELELTAGLRYDHEQKELSVKGEFLMGEDPAMIIQPDTAAKANFSALSPKVSLAYALSDLHHAYLTYSRGFRSGGITQLVPQPSLPPLYPYEPEYSNNFEAGIKNILADGRLRLNFSAFYIKVTDAQVPTLILPEAFTVTRNAGELESKGVELELASTPVKGLEAAYNFGYTDAKYTSLQSSKDGESLNGNRQIFTPDVTSMLSLQYTYTPPAHPDLHFTAGGQWQYLGQQYFDLANTISQNGYNLFHARAGVSTRYVDVFLWSHNIFDKKYIDYAYDFNAVHLGDPGTFGVSITARM